MIFFSEDFAMHPARGFINSLQRTRRHLTNLSWIVVLLLKMTISQIFDMGQGFPNTQDSKFYIPAPEEKMYY